MRRCWNGFVITGFDLPTTPDYYLTTISENAEKRVEPLCRKDSARFCKLISNLCNTNETLANQVFPVLRPDNSDSKGRCFESSQAYHQKALAFASVFC